MSRIKSIYLDWNVFQDIINKRKSDRLLENLKAAKIRGYSLPYSHAHIEDLLRCSSPEHVKKDLVELERITGKLIIGPHKDGSGFCLCEIPPSLVYKAMKQDQEKTPEPRGVKFQFQPYSVDMEKIPDNHILMPFLKKSGGIMAPELMEEFICHLQEKGLTDYKLQRGFRNSIAETVQINQPAFEVLRDLEFYNKLLSTAEQIEEDFISIFESYLKIDGRSMDSISEKEMFITSYGLLDFFPVFKEKIERKNNMKNMLTDAQHVYVASKTSQFICGDKKSVEKAKLIYRTFGVKTRIYHVDDFIENVEI